MLTTEQARAQVVSVIYSRRSGGMVDSAKLRDALDELIAAARREAPAGVGPVASGESQ